MNKSGKTIFTSGQIWNLVILLVAVPLCVVAFQYLCEVIARGLGNHGLSLPAFFEIFGDWHFYLLTLIEALGFYLWMKLLGEFDLGRAFPATAVSYCLIMVLGVVVFHDKISIQTILGAAFILSGLLLLARGEKEAINDA